MPAARADSVDEEGAATPTAVEAIKLGAIDYLTKPVLDDELSMSVDKALQQHALLAENQVLREQLTERFGMGNLVGADYRMQKVYDLIEAVADSDDVGWPEPAWVVMVRIEYRIRVASFSRCSNFCASVMSHILLGACFTVKVHP